MIGWDVGTRDETAVVIGELRGGSMRVVGPPTSLSRFLTIYERCVKMAEAQDKEPFSLWPLMDEAYAMWKANAGNAKARRRWRRRGLPNTQRRAAPVMEAVSTENVLAKALSGPFEGTGDVIGADGPISFEDAFHEHLMTQGTTHPC